MIVFGMTTYYAVKKIIQTGTKSVNAYCLVAIYIFWWIVFFGLFGLGVYSAAIAEEEIVHTMSYVSLGAVWLDLWHPITSIQTPKSRAFINKAALGNKAEESHSKSSDLYVAGNRPEGQIQKFDAKVDNHHTKQCDLKIWEFVVFMLWIVTFVSLAFVYRHKESCFLSMAVILPILVNIWMFWRHERRKMAKRICVFIVLLGIMFLIVVFTVLSCSCRGKEECEWNHIMVIASVMLFVFAHLHQKNKKV